MENNRVPIWVTSLDDSTIEFIRKFVLNSGSLKKIAAEYEVSYPTVRTMLDKTIQKIELNSKQGNVEFINLIKELVIDEKLELDTAKIIINKYKSEKKE